ncbi:hypothetical protein VPH49_21985 [Pseudomonas luteola]|uniref:hypothetical protein n=1 Tax=Pseudomonas luteola TaxID=47886 RepID=UPI003A85D9BC
MADTLSALLQGINNGVSNGLAIYKTMNDEARANRQEQLQRQRFAVEDEQWGKTYEANEANRKAQQEAAAAKQLLDTQKFGFQKMMDTAKYQLSVHDSGVKERQGDTRNSLTAAGLKLKASELALKQKEQSDKKLNGMIDDGVKRYEELNQTDPNAAQQLYQNDMTVRIGVNQRLARAAGRPMTAEEASKIVALPTGNGAHVLAHWDKGEDGTEGWQPYHPDGDGSAALTIPSSVMTSMFGGSKSLDAQQAATTEQNFGQFVGNQAQAIKGQAQALSQKKEQAEMDQARAAGGLAVNSAILARTNPDNQWWTKTEHAQAEADNTRLAGEADVAGTRAATLSDQITSLPGKAQALSQVGAQVQSLIKSQVKDPKDRAQALRNSAEVMQQSPELALRYPGMRLQDAAAEQQKATKGLIDSLISHVDTKTQYDSDGKKVDVAGGKQRLMATFQSMPMEMQVALTDATSQAPGALAKAAQDAMDLGKPEAAPYILYSDKLGIDGKKVMGLMQDKALAKYTDPNQRFELAAQAVKIAKSSDPDDLSAALGRVLTGRTPQALSQVK